MSSPENTDSSNNGAVGVLVEQFDNFPIGGSGDRVRVIRSWPEGSWNDVHRRTIHMPILGLRTAIALRRAERKAAQLAAQVGAELLPTQRYWDEDYFPGQAFARKALTPEDEAFLEKVHAAFEGRSTSSP